jgi:hypothetical protein
LPASSGSGFGSGSQASGYRGSGRATKAPTVTTTDDTPDFDRNKVSFIVIKLFIQ